MRGPLGVIFFILVGISLGAQDGQFSQFYANPIYLNPALTGSHTGTYRIMLGYRDQWRGAIDKPFQAQELSGDLKFNLSNRGSFGKGNDIVAFGMMLYNEQYNEILYHNTQLSLSAAYHKVLDKKTNQFISAGFSFGLAQRGVSYNNVFFEDQFNGVTQFNLPTSEPLPANSLVNSDLSLGLHYTVSPSALLSYSMGASLSHIIRQNISFFDRDIITTQSYTPYYLPTKKVVHLSISYQFNRLDALEPRIAYYAQGENQSIVLGTNLKHKISDESEDIFHIGAWLRASSGLQTWQPTDMIASVGYGNRGLIIGLSYDVSFRKYTSNILGDRTWEVSISYTGNHNNDKGLCPVF